MIDCIIRMDTSVISKRSVLASLFFVIASPAIIFFSFYTLKNISPVDQVHENPVRIFSSLPGDYPSVSVSFETADARAELLRAYLTRLKSPLVPYAAKIVEEADKNDLDFRLLVAIGRQESNLCRYAPEGTYNCWGWGIHKAGTLGFESFDQAIEVISLGIKSRYIDEGLTTPDQIMTKYTPHSDGSWAFAVNSFMEDLE